MEDTITDGSQLLFVQVGRRLIDEIRRGELGHGDRLPAERVLRETLGVSRGTIRRALHQLAEDGVIEGSPGRGWFVGSGRLSEPPNVLMSVSELAARHGLVATSTVLRQTVRPSTLDEAELFGVAPGAEMFLLDRVRMFDGLTVAVDESRVPLSRAPRLVAIDFSTASLMASLDACGAGPVRADFVTEADLAGDGYAAHLGVEQTSPVLVATTTSYDVAGRVVELTRSVYRSDRYRFRATLERRTPPPSAGLPPG